MAVNAQRFFPLQEAKARRRELPRYLKLDGSRYLLAALVLLCLMSMIALAQTGIVATRGYAIVELEAQRAELLRERSRLQLEHAEAQSLEHIRQRAEEIGLRPITKEQVRYVTIEDHPSAAEIQPYANQILQVNEE